MAALSAASLVAAPAAASSFLFGNQKTLRVRQVKPQVGPLRTFVPIRAEVRTGSDPGGIGNKLKDAAEKVAETVDDATAGLKDALSDARGTIRDEATGKISDRVSGGKGEVREVTIGSKEKDPSSLAANLAQQVQGAVESVTDKLTGAENATRGFDDPNQKGAFTTPGREAKKQAWGDKQAP